jgi:predicted MFS family arabinose efflux permease
VDALNAAGYEGDLESVFGRGQVVEGTAMLTGSVAGGYLAQATSLGAPFVLRAVVLTLMFAVAFKVMKDIGFSPRPRERVTREMRRIAGESIEHGWRVPAVKWIMLSSFFTAGVGIYAFYALQPYLLELSGKPEAYGIAGLVAAIVAGSQIVGGVAAPRIRTLFHRRTSALLAATGASAASLALMGLFESFWVVLGLITLWGLLFAAEMPIRQTYLNCMIPAQQRATILSFDSLVGSSGGVAVQPALGRAADVWGYGPSYTMSAGISALALPFIFQSRRQHEPGDTPETMPPEEPLVAAPAPCDTVTALEVQVGR